MQDKIAEGFRTSPQQKHLWLTQETDGSAAYRAYCAILIEGPLHTATLRSVWRDIISRHEILRTTFQYFTGITGGPLQVIAEKQPSEIQEYDFRDLSLDQQEMGIDSLVQVLHDRTDLENGPLARASLLTLASEKHWLRV